MVDAVQITIASRKEWAVCAIRLPRCNLVLPSKSIMISSHPIYISSHITFTSSCPRHRVYPPQATHRLRIQRIVIVSETILSPSSSYPPSDLSHVSDTSWLYVRYTTVGVAFSSYSMTRSSIFNPRQKRSDRASVSYPISFLHFHLRHLPPSTIRSSRSCHYRSLSQFKLKPYIWVQNRYSLSDQNRLYPITPTSLK